MEMPSRLVEGSTTQADEYWRLVKTVGDNVRDDLERALKTEKLPDELRPFMVHRYFDKRFAEWQGSVMEAAKDGRLDGSEMARYFLEHKFRDMREALRGLLDEYRLGMLRQAKVMVIKAINRHAPADTVQ